MLPSLAALLSVVSLAGWIMSARDGATLWSIRNDVPFGHSNTTAGALLLGLPWLFQSVVAARDALRRTGWALLVTISLLAIAATSSRAAVATVGGGLILATALTIWRAPWTRRSKLLLVLFASFILTGGVLTNERLRDLLLEGKWTAIAASSNEQRSAMWDAGILIIERRPLLGYGPGSVPFVYPLVRPQVGSTIDSVLQLHSSPLHLAATLGTLGLAAFMSATLWWVAVTRQLAASVAARASSLRPASLAAWTSISLYGLFALTDYQMDQPWIAAMLTLNAAVLVRPRTFPRRSLWVGSVAVILPAAIALAFATPRTWRDLTARRIYADALANSSSPAEAVEGFASAGAINPSDPYYRQQEASMAYQLSLDSSSTPAARDAWRTRARHALEATLRAGPPPEYAALNLAWLDLEDGRPADALLMFDVARLFAPNRQDLLLGTAFAQLANQAPDLAVPTLAIALLHDPTDLAHALLAPPRVRPLRSEALAWLDARRAGLETRHPDIAGQLAKLKQLAERLDSPSGEPTHSTAPYLRRRNGYPVLAYHPDGPAPVDFQLITPPPHSLIPPRPSQPGINPGLPAPVLVDLLQNPPAPDAGP